MASGLLSKPLSIFISPDRLGIENGSQLSPTCFHEGAGERGRAEEKTMLTPSMLVGFAGIALTGILLAADWYIWGSRYYLPNAARRKSVAARQKSMTSLPTVGTHPMTKAA
jgi:hypothetical protein